MTELTQLEETIAHLTRVTEELSKVVARQDQEIQSLTHKVRLLMDREAERMAAADGGVFIGDERPPHY